MSNSRIFTACGVMFIAANIIVGFYLWTIQSKERATPLSGSKNFDYEKYNREEGKRKDAAATRIAGWTALASVPLSDSAAVEEGVRAISWNGFELRQGVEGLLSRSSLSESQSADLDQAIERFLAAFARNSPQA